MEFKEIVKKRFAVRKFDGRMVPQQMMDELFEIIRMAPSSYNIQPWKIKVVTDAAVKSTLAAAAWNQPQITTCSHLLVFCADSDLMGCIDRIEKVMPQATEYIAMMRSFARKLSGEQSLAWAQRQLYIALGNAVNGAKSLGLDSCPMEGFNSVEFAKILNLPTHIVPTALCTVGYAVDSVTPKFRFPINEVFI